MTRDALAFEGIDHPTSTRKVSPDPNRSLAQLDLLAPVVPGANRAGPATSVKGVHDVLPRCGKQQTVLLFAYAEVGANGLTNAEAGERSGLAASPGSCWWKRCGELQKGGLIAEKIGEERVSLTTGSKQRVRAITPEGLALVEVLKFRARSLDKGNTTR